MSRLLARDFPGVFHSEVRPEDDPAFQQFQKERVQAVQSIVDVRVLAVPKRVTY